MAWGARADAEPRRRELLEVLVFLFLIVPSMLLSVVVVRQGGLGFVVTAWAIIARDLGLVSLIVFFLWRNGEPVGRIGWTLGNGGREASLGLGLFVVLFAGTIGLESLLRSAGVPAPATPRPQFLTARGPAELGLALALVAVVALAEETIFRGYLILRLSAVTRRPAVAALLSAIVFSLKLVSLCWSSLSTWKSEGELIARIFARATAACAASECLLDGRQFEIRGQDLPVRSDHDLEGRQEARVNHGADDVA
jgi:membrane protease YdiL (CAAX protease family)